MNRCEDCIHYDLCQALEDNGQAKKEQPDECYFFKHKQAIINLPCKLNDTVWVISKNCPEPFPAKFRLDDVDQIGQRVFLTKAEAVKRMRGVK